MWNDKSRSCKDTRVLGLKMLHITEQIMNLSAHMQLTYIFLLIFSFWKFELPKLTQP